MAVIPWKSIIDASLPALIEQAGKLFKKADHAAQPTPLAAAGAPDEDAALRERVEKLETLEAEQAKLLKQTLEELQKVSVLAAGLQARANISVIISTVAVIAAMASWF